MASSILLGAPIAIPPVPEGPCEFDFVLTDDYFKAPTQEECTKSGASELPTGHYWTAKWLIGTMIYGLVFATAGMLGLFKALIETLAKEFNLYTTNSLISLWETSVGLPDPRLGDTSLSLCDRRRAVLRRLTKVPIITLVDMQLLVDTQFPDYGIWLTSTANAEFFRYEFPLNLGGVNTRSTALIEIHIPWLAINNPPLESDPLTVDNLLSWFRDFVPAYIELRPVFAVQRSYTIITEPQNSQIVYAISDGAGDYDDITVYWKTIDVDGTVVNRVDTEDIQPDSQLITRDFTDSTVTVISDTNNVDVITLL